MLNTLAIVLLLTIIKYNLQLLVIIYFLFITLHYNCDIKSHERGTEIKKRFKSAYIEITNTCNLACTFCPKTTRKKEFMTVKNFDFIVKNITSFTEYIYLHLMGEPLLHPEFCKIIEIAKSYDLSIKITTNGTLLAENIELLSAKPVKQINISLQSILANDIDKKQYLANMYQAITKIREINNNTIIHLRLWNSLENRINSGNTFIREFLLEKYNVDIFGNQDIANGHKLSDKLLLLYANEFIWPNENNLDYKGEAFCHGLRNQIGILVDGTVVPCCLDNNGSLALGNIFDTPLNEILESQPSKALYEGFSNHIAIMELCKHCEYRTRFNRS